MVTSISHLNRADKISYIRNVMAPPAAHLTNTIDDTLVLLSKRFLIYAYLATVRRDCNAGGIDIGIACASRFNE